MAIVFKVEDLIDAEDEEQVVFDSSDLYGDGGIQPTIEEKLKELKILDNVIMDQYLEVKCEIKIQSEISGSIIPAKTSSTTPILQKIVSDPSSMMELNDDDEPGSPLQHSFTMQM